MVKSVSVVVTDDLDGSEGAQTVAFGYQGVSYEIDLGSENAAKLGSALAPFINAARRAPSGRSRRGARLPLPDGHVDRATVRSWARDQGINVSERGRISADVMSRYEASH